MTTCWPQRFDSCSASTRATESVGPPAASGTIMRTERLGHASARAARVITFGASTDAVENAISRRRVSTTLPGSLALRLVAIKGSCHVVGLRHADRATICEDGARG